MKKGLNVGLVRAGSIAEEMGVEPGDTVFSVNGRDVGDILDYSFFTKEDCLKIGLRKENGEVWELDIEKECDQDLGMDFTSTGLERITRCANKCIFCFVDQMPPGMRNSLYIKDDDYRLSFLQGSFITLTNMKDSDLNRIAQLKLSPLYISVHTTNPGLRIKMMGNPVAGDIYKQLVYLTNRGIDIHTQAVLCPGINDGNELDRTAADLFSLYPRVKSMAVVPVGLTTFRRGLFPLRRFSRTEASDIVKKVKILQNQFVKTSGCPFIYAGDEFYLFAGLPFPPHRRYADFPQTENGVGLARLFLDEWNRVRKKIPHRLRKPLTVKLVTGVLGGRLISPVADRLNQVENLNVEAVVVPNRFFGETVTVSGLLTGSDILRCENSLNNSDLIILPDTVLRRNERMMLDGLTPEDFYKAFGIPVQTAEGPREIIDLIRKAAGE